MFVVQEWIQKLMKGSLFRKQQPYDNVAPLKQEIAYLKTQLAEFRLKNTGIDTTFQFDESSIKTITATDLYEILDTSFRHVQQIKLADDEYRYTSLTEVQRWASSDPTNELEYRKNVIDCDKFALTDMANFKSENNYQLGNSVFGIVWGDANGIYHAWNIALVYDQENTRLVNLEPQTDLIWHVKDSTVNDYKPDFIYI